MALGTKEHRLLTAQDVGSIVRWTVADTPARLALTPDPDENGSVAKQLDNNSYYVLADAVTGTWVQIDSIPNGQLAHTWFHPISFWYNGAIANTWYGPEYWFGPAGGGGDTVLALKRAYGNGATPAVGNWQLIGIHVPFNSTLTQINLIGYTNSALDNPEIRWYKYDIGATGLVNPVQVGATVNVDGSVASVQLVDESQVTTDTLIAGQILVPFFRDTAISSGPNQFFGSLLFTQV